MGDDRFDQSTVGFWKVAHDMSTSAALGVALADVELCWCGTEPLGATAGAAATTGGGSGLLNTFALASSFDPTLIGASR